MRASRIVNSKVPEIQQGTLLCSTPFNPDKQFMKSIVLVTRHNSFGSSGIVLNNPTGIKISFQGLNSFLKGFELNYGGYDDEKLSFLVNLTPGEQNCKDSVYWTRNYNDLLLLLRFVDTSKAAITAYKGSVNWMPGELGEELFYHHWWTTNDYTIHDLSNNGLGSWISVAKRISGLYSPLVEANIPIIYN